MIDPAIFRAYDIRGVVGAGLDGDSARAIGAAIAGMAAERAGHERPGIAVGRDGRHSSPGLEEALAAGLNDAGADAVRIGPGPTPMLWFAVHRLETDGGVMVTGSHNPPEYNGFKTMLGRDPVHGEGIAEIARRAVAPPPPVGARGAVRDAAVKEAYVERLLSEARPEAALDVVWDAGNGAAGEVLVDLAAGLPGRHTVLFGEVDGAFPNHHPDPSDPRNLETLAAEVRSRGADLGIAFDGDGDRIGAVDGDGHIVWPDQLMILFAAEVLAERPGATVMADVKASGALFDAIARLGGKPLMWRTGSSPMRAEMKRRGCPLAGEMSGHIFFADRYFGYDDALYAAVRLLNLVAGREGGLAAFRRSLPASPTRPSCVSTARTRASSPPSKSFAPGLRPKAAT